jgi:para-nitrobenzyl esterase
MHVRHAVLAALASILPILPAHADPLKVKTAQGKVEGTLAAPAPDGTKVRAFKGIPYAAPPVGDLRWQPPQPPARFHGTFAAKDFGHRCIQSNAYPDMVFHDPGPSEDCLTLNIWAPAKAKDLPVMIWIYGGGFVSGSTSEARQDGQFLARRNVIVVSMNYRLGIFGFFAHPQLTAESPHHASGNYGLLDQAAAIAWVKQNIRNFGGNPDNITLFGESAGSFSVSSQMASPRSRDLIAKAIGESGAAFSSSSLGYPPLAQAEQTDSDFAQTAFGTSDLAALRKLSSDEILAAATSATNHHPRFGPDVDGYFLPKSVPEIFAAGEQAHIPLLAGWNADEVRGAVTQGPVKTTAESFTAEARKNYGADADAFLALYPAGSDAEALQSAGDLADDRFIAASTWLWLEAQVKTGQEPVYRYLFALGSPGDKFHPAALGAFHSDDIEYVFGTLDSRQQATWRDEDRRLSMQMQLYWTNFARSGNPNDRNAKNDIALPTWPAYKPPAWEVMRLDADPAAAPDKQRERYLFLEAHPFKPMQ